MSNTATEMQPDTKRHSLHEIEHDKMMTEQRIILTEEDNRRLCRKTDRRILAILMWIYFLQIFGEKNTPPSLLIMKIRSYSVWVTFLVCPPTWALQVTSTLLPDRFTPSLNSDGNLSHPT